MQSVSPVFNEQEVPKERVIALEQKEYEPIITLPIDFHLKDPKTGEVIVRPRMAMAVRFRLSEGERAKIAAGADLVVTEIVFGQPFTPLNFQFCQPSECPEF